jgi:predicted RNA-binding Zn-ribbon protein involved in translation (DUF1610 family)
MMAPAADAVGAVLCNEAMVVRRIPSLKVVCPHCNIPMEEQTDEAAVIQLSTRTKMVVFECPKCGAEAERQIAIPTAGRAGNWPAGW